ncbi:hypothetical protein [Clostridium butyricum]|uniref:hypothetical protein n=1 Tax=Clostridium butyricum TaxID=1492 RepID=UPI002ABD8647|nr:hypothetical protein [Clostridium butyricum]
MQSTQEELLQLESMFDVVKKPNKYILVLYKDTYNETLVDVFDTEIEALQTARKFTKKNRTLLKGTAVYVIMNDREIYSRYEDVEEII